MTGAADLDYEKLLRGVYELEGLPKNLTPESPVPDYAYNILNRLGLLYRPVADEHYLAKGGKRPEWPWGKKFAVCLTHDIDLTADAVTGLKYGLRIRQSYTENMARWRYYARLIYACFRHAFSANVLSPLDYLGCLLDYEKDLDVRSTCFFWPGLKTVVRRHPTDCLYEHSDYVLFRNRRRTIGDIMREIDLEGWEIGLHASWYAFNDPYQLRREKDAIESVINHEIVSIRQHYLHFDVVSTPVAHSEAGLLFDSTLGYSSNIGFRRGTCYPRNLVEPETGRQLPVFEIPPIIHDAAMLNPAKGMRLDLDGVLLYVKDIAEKVEVVGGVLTVIWHPTYVSSADHQEILRRLLNYLEEKDPWFATLKDIGTWWTA